MLMRPILGKYLILIHQDNYPKNVWTCKAKKKNIPLMKSVESNKDNTLSLFIICANRKVEVVKKIIASMPATVE